MKESYVIWSAVKAAAGDKDGCTKAIYDGMTDMSDGINAITLSHHPNDRPLLVAACQLAGKSIYAILDDDEKALVDNIVQQTVGITFTIKAKKQGP